MSIEYPRCNVSLFVFIARTELKPIYVQTLRQLFLWACPMFISLYLCDILLREIQILLQFEIKIEDQVSQINKYSRYICS
jgi:hypothetical protein